MKIRNPLKRTLVAGGLVLVALAAFAYAFSTRPATLEHADFTPELGGTSGGTGGGSGGGSSCTACCGTTIAGCGSFGCDIIRDDRPASGISPDITCAGAGPCPANPSNGTYACSGTVSTVAGCNYECVLGCATGYHPNTCSAAATSCVADSATVCGPGCVNCASTEIGNSTGACVNGACVDTCNSGFHGCSGSCVALGVSSCGDSCTNCATLPPSNSVVSSCSITTGTGSGGVCECSCNAGYWPAGAQACSSLSCASQSFTTTF